MPVALFLDPSRRPALDRQQSACMTVCQRIGRWPVAVCYTPTDAARLLADGVVGLIVAANPDEALTAAAGGRVAYLHQPAPRRRRRLDVGSLVRRWFGEGRDVPEIADLLGESTGAIRTELLRQVGRPRHRAA